MFCASGQEAKGEQKTGPARNPKAALKNASDYRARSGRSGNHAGGRGRAPSGPGWETSGILPSRRLECTRGRTVADCRAEWLPPAATETAPSTRLCDFRARHRPFCASRLRRPFGGGPFRVSPSAKRWPFVREDACDYALVNAAFAFCALREISLGEL